jgi:hypothetical protein
MANYTYYRVGRYVVHNDYPKQVGKIIAGSHASDRYLVRWNDGSSSRHIRGALRPATAAGDWTWNAR